MFVYRANASHPLFKIIQRIVKHLGIEDILETVLKRIGEVKIMILGDYAEGIDSGHIEILIVGENK